RQYVLAAKITVPQQGPIPSSLTITVNTAQFAQPPLGALGLGFAHNRQSKVAPTEFFSGGLIEGSRQASIPVNRDMKGDKLIKIDTLTIEANRIEVGSAASGPTKLVPPGFKVANRDAVLSVTLRAEAANTTVQLTGAPLNWRIVNDETFEEY